MKEPSKSKNKDCIFIACLIIMGLVFFFGIGQKGYIIERDSDIFIRADRFVMGYGYVIYPLFIQLIRTMIGPEYYLDAVFIIQGLISLVASLLLTLQLKKRYRLNYSVSVLLFLCSLGPYTYTLPEYVSSHCIMTESLAFPLFYIWIILAIFIYTDKKNSLFVLLILQTIILILSRPQLLFLLIVVILLAIERIVDCLVRNNPNKFRVISIVIVITVFLAIFSFPEIVRYSILPQLTDAVTGRVFCIANHEDAELFEGADKDLVKKLLTEIDTMGTSEEYFRDDIHRWEDIAHAINENTKYIGDAVVQYMIDDPRSSYEIKSELAYRLLVKHWDKYIYLTLPLLIQSLVVSVFYHPESAYVLGYIISVLIYVFGCSLAFVSVKKKACKIEYIIPFIISMLVLLTNAVVTNVVFMGLQRYVVYSFGCYYFSMIIMLVGVIRRDE